MRPGTHAGPGPARRVFIISLLLLCPLLPLSAQTLGQLSATLPPLSPRMLSLDETLKTLSPGAELHWDPLFRAGTLSAAGHKIAFGAGLPGENGAVILDGRDILTLPLPYTEQGALRFPEPFVSTLRDTLRDTLGTSRARLPEEELPRFRIAAIVVDPGHGGKDSGAVGSHAIDGKTLKAVEKDITLQVSRQVHARLAAAYPDKRVLMTRTGDTFPTLEDRVSFAHDIPLKDDEAIIFISVHANSSFNTKARGYEVWYLNPDYRRTVIDRDKSGDSADILSIRNDMLEEEFTTESIIMARSILSGLDEYLGALMPSRGIKAEEWFVVRNARMPSVLVELGFVSNPEDAKLLTGETHLRKFSDALYKGIVDFIALFERSGGFTAIR